MKKFKLVMVALMLSAGALAGCDNNDQPTPGPTPDPTPVHTHTFSNEWSSDESSHWHAATCGHDVKSDEAAHTFGADGKCSVCSYYDESHDESKVFTDEKLGAFKGVFYGGDSVFTISKDGVVVQEGEETYILENNTIKGSGYSTVVTYKGPENTEFTLKWKKAEWDGNNLNLMLPTFVSGNEEFQIQPTIDKAQGWYDGWYDNMDYGTQIYIISNDFNVEKDAFQMYAANFSYNYLGLGLYLRSSFVKIGDKLELGLSWFDEEDMAAGFNYSDWNYYLAKGEDGSLIMADIDPEEVIAEWWTRPTFFLGEFIRPSSKEIPLGNIFDYWEYDSYTFWADEDNKTVSVNDDDYLPYIQESDEYGAYVLVDGTKYRGTSYGISVETAEGVEECPVFFFSDFYYLQGHSYISGNDSISFAIGYDEETWEPEGYLEINGVKADKSYLTFVDNIVAIGADVGEDKYFMTLYDGEDAVLVGKNDNLSIYVNSDQMSNFVGSFFDEEFTVLTVSEKEGSLTVKFKGLEFDASLTYTDDFGIVVSFGEDGIIAPLNDDKTVFVALFGESSFVFLFEKNSVLGALGEWTSGLIDATFSNDLSVVFAGQDMSMLGLTALQSTMGDFASGCVFGTQDVQFVALLDDACTYIYELGEEGELNFISSFVRPEVFATFYGEFNYLGEYGKEKVSLSEEGILTVTTMNETKDGIIDQQFNYQPFVFEYYSSTEAGLEFNFENVDIDIVYDGKGHCSIFTVTYLAKAFFDNQGLFGSSKDSYLSIVDNKVVYNGDAVSVVSFDADSIQGTLDGEDITIEFSGSEASITVGEEEPVVLAKNGVTVASFACEAQENIGNLGEDIKVTEDGKILAHNVNDPEGVWNEITDYQFGIDEAGNAFIKASYKAAYTYTISIVEGDVVITGESSLPPLPPPPPPLPF